MWVFLAILAVPLIEIGLFVVIGGMIGVWATLAWVLIAAALGLLVLRRVGMSGAVTLRSDMQELRDAQSPVAHRVILVLAGTLLLLPGFFTDAMGLLMLLRPVRTGLIRLIVRRMGIDPVPSPAPADVIDGEWREVGGEDATRRSDTPSGWTRH